MSRIGSFESALCLNLSFPGYVGSGVASTRLAVLRLPGMHIDQLRAREREREQLQRQPGAF